MMSNDRLQQQMQEALDGALDQELIQELFEQLDQDPEANAQFDLLQSVDMMLKTAPYERAPQQLALNILTKVAESVQTQAEMQALPEATQKALQISMSLVIMLMMPTMLYASWMVMRLHANPKLLTQAINELIALMVMVIDALKMMLEQAEMMAKDQPQMASFMMSLIPLILLEILKSMEEQYLLSEEPTV